MKRAKALVVLSGGQDSVTCLFLALRTFGEVYAITFDYGQRHKIEIEAAIKVAQMAGLGDRHKIVNIPDILVSTSPLTSAAPLEQYENAQQMEEVIGDRVELTFVPMRNMLFLTIAMNHAVALGCDHVVTGICQEDNANYPDCRAEFKKAFQNTANLALGTEGQGNNPGRFEIHAPLMYCDKARTVKLAAEIPECWHALAYSHTSYDGTFPPTDMNHANVLRAQGFEDAGLPDPLVVRAWYEGKMPLPVTANYQNQGELDKILEMLSGGA